MSVALEKEQVEEAFGFNAPAFLKKVKDEVGVGKVRLVFDGDKSRAHAIHVGEICQIHLPTREAIQRERGFDAKTAIAKQKAALAEESCHCREHETDHNEAVVTCTIKMMKKHMTPEELELPYIKEKVRRLEMSPERVEKLQPLPS